MNTNSNKYTLVYSIVMVVIVAAILTLISVSLQPRQNKNIEMEKKSNILKTIGISTNKDNTETLFGKYITEIFAINRNGEILEFDNAFNISLREELKKDIPDQKLPVFIANLDDGTQKYILALEGKGLWGGIWGYISLEEDLNTVFGVNFDHASETPGLGAEIATDDFENEFKRKKIFDENNKLVSVTVTKKITKDNIHAVDAISGGTITSNGVNNMLKNCLFAYSNFINNLKTK